MDEIEDDVVEVGCETTGIEEKVKAKLLEIRSFVPFIQRVRMEYQRTLSDVQGHRLDSLIGLLERDNVSMNTLNKIERIVEKLKNRFEPRISGEVIEIKDHAEPVARTGARSQPRPAAQRSKTSVAGSKPNGLPNSSSNAAKPKPLVTGIIKSNGSPIPPPAATKAKPAIPKAREPERGSLATSKTAGSLPATKTRDVKPSKPPDEQKHTVLGLPVSAQATAQAKLQDADPAIPEPAASPGVASVKSSGSLPSSPHNRGVLAAMQEARMEEKKQRVNAQQTSPAKESFAPAPPESDFTRRSGPASPQFSRRMPDKPMQTDIPDFVRRSAPFVPIPCVQEACPRQSEKEADSPASISLEEARKKLAALRGGALIVPEMPPLSSNTNDPRGKKSLPMSNNTSDINISLPLLIPPLLTPPLIIRSPSPIPPPPSMRIGTWAPFSNIPLETGFSVAASSREPPSIEPRDPRIWQNKPTSSHSHQQKQQQQQQPSPQPTQGHSHSADPRRAPSVYSGYEEPANSWQSSSSNSNNNNANANGNAYNKSSWSGSLKGNSGANARGFNGNQNGSGNAVGFRGGYRGGHSNKSRGFGNPGTRFDRPNDVPRTYGEHRKAKARAEAEAKAKAAEEERQLIADIQRQMDADEKRKALAAEKQRMREESEAAAAAAAAAAPVPELDTSYRNVTLGPLTKKLDFRIPKKTPPAAPASGNGEGDNLSSSSSSLTSKSCDAKKDKDTDKNKDKSKDKDKDKVELSKDKSENSTDKSKKHHKSQDRKSQKEKSKSEKKERKRLDKEKEKEQGKKARGLDKARDFVDTDSVISVNSSENTDNLENEPPVSEANSSPVSELLAPSTPDIQPGQTGSKASISEATPSASLETRQRDDDEDEDEDIFDSLKRFKKATARKRAVSTSEAKPADGKSDKDDKETETEKEKEDEEKREDALQEKEEEDKPPKLSKLKIVLGPNAHTLIVQPGKDDLEKEKEAKLMDHKPLADEHDDEEVPGPSPQLLRRIMQRRNSMAPTASKPLVDKADIFKPSLVYEDLQEQKRKSQNARSLANMFEKTNDNCSVSTHNIITGKRRTRGLEASFNEVQLSRSCFGLGQITRTRAARAKTPAPPSASAPASDSAKQSEESLAVDPTPAPTRKRRRQTTYKETADVDVQVEPKKARLESEEIGDAKQPKQPVEEVTIMDTDENSSEPVIQPPPKPRTKPRKKRNELDKLNEDIAQMYYGEEVLRATGRRACTRRSRTPSQTRSVSQRSSSQRSRTPSLSRASPAGDSISSVSVASPIFIRNVARRGKAFTPGSGINRTFKKAPLMKTKRFEVKMKRCVQLNEMMRKEDEKEQQEQQKPAKKGQKRKEEVRNTNSEWHAKSKATIKCVVCSKPVRRSPLCHYVLHHEEHYAARLPPGVLEELRAGRGNQPDYSIMHRGMYTLHFTCPFCQKALLLSRQKLGEHLANHMGEPRYQCSHCHFPQNRLDRLQAHIATCGADAKPLSHPNSGRLPMEVHVCHLCQFVQQDRQNMDRHLVGQHGLTKEQLKSVDREELTLCSRKDVPSAKTREEGNAILREKQEGSSKPSGSARVPATPMVAKKQRKAQKKIKIRFKNMAKKSVRLVKREREEREEEEEVEEEEALEAEEEEQQEQDVPVTKMEVDLDMAQLPQPPPEKEPVLVVNECLIDVEMDADLDGDMDEEQAIQSKSMMVDEKPVVLRDLLADLVESTQPTVEETVPVAPLPMEEDADDDEDEDVDVEQVTPPRPPSVELAARAARAVSLAELDADLLDGIGSDGSDVEIEDEPLVPVDANGGDDDDNDDDANYDDDDDDDAKTDQWVDLETAKRAKHSKGTKSIFQKFNRFCSRLNKATRASGKAVASNSSHSSDGSNDVPDPSELMPQMQPLEPEAAEPAEQTDQPVSADPAADLVEALIVPSVATRPKAPPKRVVENVAFRKSPPDEVQNQQASYYCVRPGCPFLFSNELEGLENHFAREHPLVLWSGKCAICPELRAMESNLSISEELRHMRDEHMVDKSNLPPVVEPVIETPTIDLSESEPLPASEPDPAPEPAAEPVPDPVPVPVLPKLRVRRFTGDRLVEPPPTEQQQQQQPETVNPPAVEEPQSNKTPNGMLRHLLAAEPRPPNQQVDLNAAGLGEFLCAKPTSVPAEATMAAEEHPVIINYQSGLGLSISQVYSRAQMSANPVLSPAVEDPQPEQLATPPVQEANRNRFRCMASGCSFTALKVMFVREHMKFHSFSFSTGYLNCSYCSHVAVDVDDYLRHGVIIHDLAPRSDLEGDSGPPSVSQQIRDMLNQRSGRLPTANPTGAQQPSAASSSSSSNPEAGGDSAAGSAAVGPNGLVSVSVAITDLLRPTGYSEDKLYACPQRGCIGRLSEEQFVNHLRYHIRSTHQGSEQVKCKYCTKEMQAPALRTHLQQAHARHTIFCGMCLATAVNKRLMLYHVRNEHPEAYELVNRQLQFIQMRMKPDALAKGTVQVDCFVAAVEQPFGAYQMHNFQRKLFEELALRRDGTKTVFRGSEVRLLPRVPIFSQEMRCAECPFVTKKRSDFQVHLYRHKEEAIAQAYQTEEPPAQPEAVETPLDESASTSGQGASQAAAPQQSDPQVPGKHRIFKPPYEYVPSTGRYRCGFIQCVRLFTSEAALRQHMIGRHKYSEVIYCPHCQMRPGQVSVDKYMDHLLMHKRHVYQCGACNRHNSKRVAIEKHIQDRHYNQNVDVVVHRHSSYDNTISTRWLKTPKLARHALMDYTCNLCHLYFPSTVQIMAHAASVHDRSHQYHCAHCTFGGNEATRIIDHIRAEHPGKLVQPVQVYQRIVCKNKQTLGFFCSLCQESANSFQRISAHCEEKHKSRFTWKCPHCDVGHLKERHVAIHITAAHPQEAGLSVIQFERVANEMPDDLSWELAQPIEPMPEEEDAEEEELEQEPAQEQLPVPVPAKVNVPLTLADKGVFVALGQTGKPGEESRERPLPEPQIVTEVVDLLASDDESEESGESQDEPKIVEFACTHCDETYNNLQDLRTQHYARRHPEQPFYFRVQPTLLCTECKDFKANAKVLREEHLIRVHSIRNFVAADIRQPAECAYCDYRYRHWQDLAQHISSVGHMPNDLKHVTNDELDALMLLSASGKGGAPNEYFQCGLCSVVMPTMAAIAQHGQVEHSKPGERFCFRQLKAKVIYHCFKCMFTSTDELTTLRHMVDHYSRFKVCHFCTRPQPGGFDEYIQHCYTHHRDDVHRFRDVHSFSDLKKFLMQVYYQFQNGLIITKSSLRYTRFNSDSMMRRLDNELMAKAQRPPIPRLHIRLKSTGIGGGQQEVEVQVEGPLPLARIAKRRKTLNPDELLRISRQEDQDQRPPEANRVLNRVPAVIGASSTSSPATASHPPAGIPTVSLVGNQVRVLKRRNSHVVRSGP